MKQLAALLVLTLAGSCPAAAPSVFYYTSSPTAFTGMGETRLLIPADGYFFSGFKYESQGSNTNAFSFEVEDNPLDPGHEFWFLRFVGPNFSNLTPGFYGDAQRWPFQQPGHPGLSFSGNGRGSGTLTGEFKVLEVSFSGATVKSFAVDFMQYDRGFPSQWNYGSFRYHSDIPITPLPEPHAAALSLIAAFLWPRRSHRR